MAVSQSTTGTRLARLRERLAHVEADALLVSDAYNRRYLSGFTGTSGWLLVSSADAVLVTDFRYVEQAGKQAPDFSIVRQTGKVPPLLLEVCQEYGWRRLAFEADHVTVATHQSYQEAFGQSLALVPTTGLVEALRTVKEPDEIAAIRKAIRIADDALAGLLTWLQPGVTEKDVAWRLEVLMREAGAEGLSFPSIVACGPNAAMPHHRSSNDLIRPNEFIVMDFGCVADGYCSDMTRTVMLGTPSAEMKQIYQLVLQAQETAEATIRAGMSGIEADHIARSIIAEAGHGEHFGHGLGHGVGLEIHEAPRLSPSAGPEPLPAGAVVSVEPGVYVPGLGGVRIEDLVVLQPDGVEVLTNSPKDRYA